jgi:hypothetical protein
MSYICVTYLLVLVSGMDPQGNPMPPGFPLIPPTPVDVPEDPSAHADIPFE